MISQFSVFLNLLYKIPTVLSTAYLNEKPLETLETRKFLKHPRAPGFYFVQHSKLR
jgi:hypothetical protein